MACAGTGVLIKPAFVLTAGHVVGVETNSGTFVANPAITPAGTKVRTSADELRRQHPRLKHLTCCR